MFHSMLNPSNRRRCYRCKDNYYFEVLQIGDLLLRRELDIKFKHSKTQLSGEILPQRKLPRTITLRNISSEIGLIKYIFDVASFEEDLTNRV